MKPQLDTDYIVAGLLVIIGFFVGVIATLTLGLISFTSAGLSM